MDDIKENKDKIDREFLRDEFWTVAEKTKTKFSTIFWGVFCALVAFSLLVLLLNALVGWFFLSWLGWVGK